MVCEVAWEVSAPDYSNPCRLTWSVTEERISPVCAGDCVFSHEQIQYSKPFRGLYPGELSKSCIEPYLFINQEMDIIECVYILECYTVLILNSP